MPLSHKRPSEVSMNSTSAGLPSLGPRDVNVVRPFGFEDCCKTSWVKAWPGPTSKKMVAPFLMAVSTACPKRTVRRNWLAQYEPPGAIACSIHVPENVDIQGSTGLCCRTLSANSVKRSTIGSIIEEWKA